MKGWAWWEKAVIALVGVLLLIAARSLRADPGNAPDVRGHFTLVASATVHRRTGNVCYGSDNDRSFDCFVLQQQPLTVIPGFLSFKLCVAAGRELQARLGTDGYVLDFACVATGRL